MTENSVQPKSSFVPVISWIFIVLGFLMFLNYLIQVVIAFTFMSDPMLDSFQSEDGTVDFYMKYFKPILAVSILINLYFIVSSIGLLKRREWARKSIIALSVFYVSLFIFFTIYNLLSFYEFGDSDSLSDFQSIEWIVIIILIVFDSAVAALVAWIVKKLRSQAIVSEFA